MALPVISTNWSGLTEFMSDAVAYPIKIDGLITIKPDGPGFFKAFEGQRWAQPSEAHLTALLRHVAENRDEARARGEAARRMVLERFTPAVLAGVVDRHVRRIQGVVAARRRQEERAAAAALARRGAGGWFHGLGGDGGGSPDSSDSPDTSGGSTSGGGSDSTSGSGSSSGASAADKSDGDAVMPLISAVTDT